MARGLPATQVADARTGLVVALTAAPADGDSAADGGTGVYAVVENGSGAPIDVTLVNPQTLYGDDVADRVVSVAAGVTRHIPLPASFKQDLGTMDGGVDVGGKVLINYSAVATVARGIARF